MYQAPELPGRRHLPLRQLPAKAGHSSIGNTAGNDSPEALEIVLEIEGETMRGNPAIAAYTEGGDLSWRASRNPYPCSPLDPHALETELRQHSDNSVFEPAQVAVNIPAARRLGEIDDRIPDKLPRLMAGNISPPRGLYNHHSAGLEVVCGQ